jgi:hypothetical protein
MATHDDALGCAVGIAAFVASMPGAADVNADKVRALIDELLLNMKSANPDVAGAARSIASGIYARAG